MFKLMEEVLEFGYDALLMIDFFLSSFLIVFISLSKGLNLVLVLVLQILQLKKLDKH